MLIVGLTGDGSQLVRTGASNVEYRTHFNVWAMVASAFLTGSDVRSLETRSNKEVIAVNQDSLGMSAEAGGSEENEDLKVYAKEMSDGRYAVPLLNRGSFTAVHVGI